MGKLVFKDNIVVTVYVLNGVVSKKDEMVVKKHWAGVEDVLEVVRKTLKLADQIIGSGLVKKIKKCLMILNLYKMLLLRT